MHVDNGCRVRRNYPYLGKGDGLTTWLRRRFFSSEYAGVEIELNQAALAKHDAVATTLIRAIQNICLVTAGASSRR